VNTHKPDFPFAPATEVMTIKARAHLFVSGQVQGVFFRSKTRLNAKKYGVKGWVRNLPDGRVEILFEGEKADVEKLIEFCRNGPLGARVANVDVMWETYRGEYRDFEIVFS